MDSTKNFLDAVLPASGFHYLFALMPDRRPVQRDFAAEERADLLGFARWAVGKGADVYVAIGAYEPGPDGLKRTALCARRHQCLRLDIDCGPGKDYPDQRAGAAALQAFVTATRLPRPWIVDSGYGLHVYWPFTEPLSVEQWLPLADALGAATRAHGLQVDSTATSDAARVLRLPGTTNFKHGALRPVRVLIEGARTPAQELAARLSAEIPAAPGSGPLMVPAALLQASHGELGADQYPPYTLRGVLTACPGMRTMFQTRGAHAREPLWKGVLDLVHRSAEEPDTKLRVAHTLSSGHPGYDPQALEAKWAQVERQNYQPPTCATFAGAGMAECATCPLRGSIKSPVVLGRPQAPVAAPDPPAVPIPPPPLPASTLPPGVSAVQAPSAAGGPYTIGVFHVDPSSATVRIVDGPLTRRLSIRDGIPHVLASVDVADGEGTAQTKQVWRPIGSYRIVEAERLLDRMGRQSITAITFDRNSDGHARVEATNADLSETRAFNRLLIAHGLYMNSNDAKALQDKFMPEFLAQFQRIRAANQIAARCGWTDDRKAFVLGTTLYTATTQEHVRPAGAPEEMEAYHVAGDEAVWRRAFDITLSGGPDRQAVLALAIAAPLMVFTGIDGVMLNAYSPESGVGKSTLCDAVLSVWGSPNKLRKDYRDTANATFKLAAVVGNLPMVVDEFTNVEGRALSDYVYSITQGRERHRLTSDSRLQANASRWCLPTIVTSNNSVHDKLQSYRGDAVAEAARVFELRLHPLGVPPELMGSRKIELLQLRSNYGFLGPKLVRLMLQRAPEEWQRIVADRIAWWDREVSQDTSDRFRSAAAALIDIGSAIGTAMGFAFDRLAILTEIRRQWRDQQEEFEMSRRQPMDFVNEFIVENLADFAIIGGVATDSLVTHGRRYRGEIRGRSVNGRFAPERVVIPLATFRDYVRERNGNYKALLEWLRSETRPEGVVEKVGTMMFLEGLLQQVRTQAVALRPAVLGAANLRIVGPSTDIPPAFSEKG